MVREFYFGIERNLEPEDVAAFTRMGAYESLLAGVGLVWDHYYHAEAVAEALASTGLAGVVAPTLQDLSGPGVQWREAQLRATETIARSTALLERGVVAAVGPHATDTVSEDLWRESCDLARSLGIPLHAHLAQSLEEHSFSIEQRGAPPARWLVSLGVLDGVPAAAFAHAIYVSRPELALLDAKRDLLVFCPCSQLVFGFPADPLAWEEAGLRWAVATDCSPSNDSMNVQKELRHVAGLRTMGATWSREYRGLSRRGRREAGARLAARGESGHVSSSGRRGSPRPRLYSRGSGAFRERFIRLCRAGVLEEGAFASFVVWDADHPSMWPEAGLSTLAMGDTTPAIHAMFVAGREIGEAGEFHRSVVESEDYRRASEEASRRRTMVLGP